MAEFRQNNAGLWVSKLPETSFNTAYTAGADYAKVATQNPIVLIPEMEKANDAGRAGNGHEFATYICNRYWLGSSLGLQDDVNFDVAGRLLLRGAGGTVTDSVASAGVAWKHAAPMLPIASGLQQPSFDVISELGGASFLLYGAVVERFRLSQDLANAPQFQCDIITSGKHKSPHAVTSLPATPNVTQCLKARSSVTWTDSGGARNFSSGSCALRSWFCEVVNNHQPTNDRCSGDTEQIPSVPGTTSGNGAAAYLSKLTHGDRVVTAQIVILLDSTLPEFVKMAENEVITDVTFSALGPDLAAGVPARLTMILPNARISSLQEVDSNGKAALAINLLALYDATALGNLETEVVNDIDGASPDYR